MAIISCSSPAGILFPTQVNGQNCGNVTYQQMSMKIISMKMKSIHCCSSSAPKTDPGKSNNKNNNMFFKRTVKHLEAETTKLLIKGILTSIVTVFFFQGLLGLLGSRYKGVSDYLDREMMIKIRVSAIDYVDQKVEEEKVAQGKY